jgi:hypothetical protein
MSANWKADVDSAYLAFGVSRATTSGLTPDTLDVRILKDQLPQQVILDQLTILVPPNLNGNVPDAYYVVEFEFDNPVAQIHPTPADFWLSWRMRGPAGDKMRVRLKNPALNPRRSVTIGSAGDTTMATLFVTSQLGLARQDSVDLWAEVRVCYPDGIPVELTSFTASYLDGEAELRWRTATEQNNMGFYIERLAASSEGGARLWQQLGFVNGHGTSTQAHTYRFLDPRPSDAALENGAVMYRLRQIDFDGSTQHSPVAEIHIPTSRGFALEQNHPNPATLSSARTVVSFQIPEASDIELSMFDALGRKVSTIAKGAYASGRHFVELPLAGLRPGIYFYRLSTGNSVLVRRMMVTE